MVNPKGTPYRSGIERIFAERLNEENIEFAYEGLVLEHNGVRYIPDFIIDDIVVELKGRASENDIDKAKVAMFNSDRVSKYIVVGDTNIDMMSADHHFNFDEELDTAIETIKTYTQ